MWTSRTTLTHGLAAGSIPLQLRKQCIPVGDEGVLVASPREGFTYCDYIGYDTMNAPPLIPIPAKQCSPDASLGTAASNGNDDHGEQKTEDNLRKVLQENFAPGRPLTPFLNMLRCLPVDHHLGDSNSSSVSVAPSAQPQGQLPASSGRATASKRAKLGSVKLPYLNEGKSKLQNTQSTRRLVPSILHPYYRTTTSRNVETSAPTPVPGMSVAAARRRSLDPFLLPSTRVDQKGSSSRTESAKVSLPSLRSVVDSRIMEPLQEPSGMQDMLAAAPLSTSSAVWPEGSVIPHPAEGGAIPNPPSSQPMPMLANDSWAGGNGFLPADANLHGSAWPSFHWPSSSFDLHQTIDAMLPLSFETTTTSSIGSSTPSSILVSTPGAFTHLGNDSSKQVSAIDSYFPPMPIPSSLAFYEPLPASTYSPSVEYGASDSALAPPVSSFVAQQMSNTATAYHPGLPSKLQYLDMDMADIRS